MTTYKPTKQDCNIIRDCAKRSAGTGRVKLEIGERFNTVDLSKPVHVNIAIVADDWNDTDLSNNWPWADFVKGVELTADGRGIFDFYVYSLGEYGQLETNVTAYYEGGELEHVEGTGDGIMWRR